jgi:transcriptional regulator with XRE-family HTH domain
MTPNNQMSISAQIKAHRKALGITQKQLAKVLGYSIETIRKIEQGKYPVSNELLQRLGKALNVSEEELTQPAAPPSLETKGVGSSEAMPTSSRRVWLLWVGLAFVGGLCYLFLRTATDLRPIRLASPAEGLVRMETDNRPILPGDSIQIGELVTVTFRIHNWSLSPVVVKLLVIGCRGPDALRLGWNAPDCPFLPATHIMLWPGGEYQYQQSRTFLLLGDYFIEPNIQNMWGEWGGISPNTRINFFVVEP